MKKIEPITRDFLRRVAMASTFAITDEMHLVLCEFASKGLYAEASEDDIERFDCALESMETCAGCGYNPRYCLCEPMPTRERMRVHRNLQPTFASRDAAARAELVLAKD